MSRPLAMQDYLLIGVVLGAVFACVVLLVCCYRSKVPAMKRRVSLDDLPAGQDFGQMNRANGDSSAGEGSLDLHQATGIDRHHRASAGPQD